MNSRLLLLIAIACLAACSLLSTPSGTVKKFIAAAEQGDAEAMTKLFSQKAVQRFGLEKIRSNNQQFADNASAAIKASGKFHMENVKETTTATGRRVSFLYRSEKGDQSLPLIFDLSKEGGAWKIDNIGGNSIDECVDGHRRIRLADAGRRRNLIDQIGFIHAFSCRLAPVAGD